ncbi:magnesium transporter [Pelosinus propionicus DSM 13327]|uniref:Magnesium transport protein CorA n=1 Tax=Pelosinus propionicus DSM 13327 TaxID=1123291 RepID=A0A1I4KZE5_9FIRM|nr:magnesium transporter [Pelosinus propionicus DSM 13327]
MPGRYKQITKKVGLPPGTLLHIGSKRSEKVKIRKLCYSSDDWTEKEFDKVDELLESISSAEKCWIHISGVHVVSMVEKIGAAFQIHSLVLEDIVNTNQRPKMEDNKEYLYIIVKMIHCYENNIDFEQVSLIVGNNYIVSFQENDNDTFTKIRERIKSTNGIIRSKDVDYLAYALLDCIVDNYYVALEYLGDKIEQLENRIIVHPQPKVLKEIHTLKNEMLFVRKAVWPLREIINALSRGDSALFKKDTLIYIRDVYDHMIQVIDSIEMYRDMVTGMLDLYLSNVSFKTNEVMKVLTIIATIFIPLTFIVGLYGMNFKYMPELEWKWGYPAILLIMAFISGCMIIYFRKKKWM